MTHGFGVTTTQYLGIDRVGQPTLQIAAFAGRRFCLDNKPRVTCERGFLYVPEAIALNYDTTTKLCCHCKIEKPLSEYYKNKSTRDGYSYDCKHCHHFSRSSRQPRAKSLKGFTQLATGYIIHFWQKDGKQHREYEHRAVWRAHYGDIPTGYVVHHKDGNKTNNDISNLECIPKSECSALHSYKATRLIDMHCTHCGRKRIKANGLCRPCNNHLTKYGCLPSLEPKHKPTHCISCGREQIRAKGMCGSCYVMHRNRVNSAGMRLS
jgi:hypothetical protein